MEPHDFTAAALADDPTPILYEDDDILAVYKPTGMLVHRGWADAEEVLVDRVREMVSGEKVHTIHRIDRATSGAVLFGQHPEAARALNALFDERSIQKQYLALVRGVAPEMGYIDYAIPKKRRGKTRIEAQSSFRRVWETWETEPREVSLVEVVPHTGRLHQIRRHIRHIHHPLIGDSSYGRGKLNRAFADAYGLDRLALHALSLTFEHPFRATRVRIVAPLAPDLREAFGRMGMEATVWEVLERGEVDWLDAAAEHVFDE